MRAPAIPENESARVAALQNLNILYTPAEERFDRITRLAARLFDAPICTVSLVTPDSQWFKSCQGLATSETDRDISFCGHAILNDDVFVVPNALKDPDFRDNPLVIDFPHIRFYAGQPIRFNGYRLGTLCIIDQRPRQLSPGDFDSLKCLAGWVESELALWHEKSNTLLRRMLSTSDRAGLIDPVTGSLTPDGLAWVAQAEASDDTGPLQFSVEIPQLESIDDQDKLNLVRKQVAQSLRSILDEKGLLGLSGANRFTVILSQEFAGQAKSLSRRMVDAVTQTLEQSGYPLQVEVTRG